MSAARNDADKDIFVGSYTVFLCAASDLPEFTLRPPDLGLRLAAMLGIQGMTFNSGGSLSPVDAATVAKFRNRFKLWSTDDISRVDTASVENDIAVRRLFSPQVMNLFNQHAGCSVEVRGGQMAIWRGRGHR